LIETQTSNPNTLSRLHSEINERRPSLIGYWPIVAAILVLWLVIGMELFFSLKPVNNQFHLVYALDDAYIHMSMARNFAEYGVWGVTPFEFSSSSSSLLWTLLLALIYWLIGSNEWIPLILNLFFATLVIILGFIILNRFLVARVYQFLALLALIFLPPLPALIFSGMEHCLQIFLVILFVDLSGLVLYRGRSKRYIALEIGWLGTASLLVMVRYESLFIIGIVWFLTLLRRRWWQAVLLALLTSFPVLAYGVKSITNHSFWLPNSVLLKGHSPEFSLEGIAKIFGYTNLSKSGATFLLAPHLFLLAIVTLVLFWWHFKRGQAFWENGQLRLLILLATVLIHTELAALDWFYRYEAYLVALGVVTFSWILFDYLSDQAYYARPKGHHRFWVYLSSSAFAFLILLPFTDRAARSLIQIPQATTNIYQQQYQMGLFLNQYYPQTLVAAHDIGAITYLSPNLRLLDLAGLGSAEITRYIKEGRFTNQMVEELSNAKDVKIAIVYNPVPSFYEHFRGDIIPPNWIEVANWTIKGNIVLGAEVVHFYAVDPSEQSKLRTSLSAFQAKLPEEVEQVLLPTTYSPALEHQAEILAVAYSPDSRLVASGSADGVVKLWNAPNGKLKLTLAGQDAAVKAVAFSPDGRNLATASIDGTIKLWDIFSGQQLGSLTGHTAEVTSLAYVPGSKLLASGSLDGTIRLWNTAKPHLVSKLSNTSPILSLSFTSDGKEVACGSGDKTIKLWDIENNQMIGVLYGHTDLVWSVAFSPDGKTLASASADQTVRLWDVTSRKTRFTFSQNEYTIWSVAFAPDGKTVASASSDSRIRLWEVNTGKLKSVLSGHLKDVSSIAYSYDGKQLVSGSFDMQLHWWSQP